MIHKFNEFIKIYESTLSAQQAAFIEAAADTAVKEELKDKEPVATNPSSSLKFDGEYLHWLNRGVSVAKWKATSGLTFGNTPLSDYGKMFSIRFGDKDEAAKEKDAGPTPPGKYQLGNLQTRKGVKVNDPETYKADDISLLKAFWVFKRSNAAELEQLGKWGVDSDLSKIGWGDFRVDLIPDKANNMYGRGSMYIHGGAIAGSHGCIDLTDQMPEFAKWYTAWLIKKENKNKKLTLLVEYPKPRPAESNPTYNNSHYSQTTRMGVF